MISIQTVKIPESDLTASLLGIKDDITTVRVMGGKRILEGAGAALLNRNRTRYLAETDPDGVPWLPSKAGIARRLKGGTGTLFDTGLLFHSIQLHPVDDENMAISTDRPYAGYVAEGWDYLGFSSEDLDLFTAIMDSGLAKIGVKFGAS